MFLRRFLTKGSWTRQREQRIAGLEDCKKWQKCFTVVVISGLNYKGQEKALVSTDYFKITSAELMSK